MIYNRTNRKSFLTRSRKKWLNYENGGKPQQEVLKKFYLFISLFVGLLRKFKKKQSIVAFLNKLNFFLFFFFLCETLENPCFVRYTLEAWKTLEFSWHKPWKIQKNTLENPWNSWNLNLNLAGNPALATSTTKATIRNVEKRDQYGGNRLLVNVNVFNFQLSYKRLFCS